jgi:hypothetical protein
MIPTVQISRRQHTQIDLEQAVAHALGTSKSAEAARHEAFPLRLAEPPIGVLRTGHADAPGDDAGVASAT